MITLPVICILLFAASLPVIYLTIIHRSLSGAAANDPDFDVDAQVKASLGGTGSAQVAATANHSGGTPRHA